MYIQQLYTNCLAEAAYYIESGNEAAIIDPMREPEPYLKLAEERGAKIKYVFETHFHADFISGHIDLAKKSGAEIVFGPGARTAYKVYNASDNELFKIGNISIKALHTPGHTPESTSFLLLDEEGKQYAVFTGDTLFVGDVGRPDLLDGVMSKEVLASHLFDSLKNKIKTLEDQVLVYPAHGAGSACGKNIGKETWSTIGQQKQSNYALLIEDREMFVKAITEGLAAPPAYFFKDAAINKNGYNEIDEVLKNTLNPLSAEEVNKLVSGGIQILDTRNAEVFAKGFIKNSINIGLDGTFAVWLGTLIHIDTPLIIVADEGKENESVVRMLRVGFEKIKGYLSGGIQSWLDAGYPAESIPSVDASYLASEANSNKLILDVRRADEYDTAHVKNAIHIPLTELSEKQQQLDKNKTYMVYCGGGYRSMIAASMLNSMGFQHLINISGGWAKIKNTDIQIEKSSFTNA